MTGMEAMPSRVASMPALLTSRLARDVERKGTNMWNDTPHQIMPFTNQNHYLCSVHL